MTPIRAKRQQVVYEHFTPPQHIPDSSTGVVRGWCRLAFLIFGLVLFLPATRLSGQILFNHLDHTNGLPQINVMSVYQDETGAIWFGTISGLCRYNGSSTRVFYSSPEYPGLTKNSILSITGNRNGAVYIRTEYDLIRYDIAADSFRVISDGATGMFYGNGKLWFTVGDKLYTWSEESETISFHSGTERDPLSVSTEGNVWCGGSNGVTIVENPRSGKGNRRVLGGVFVYSLYIDSEGLVWAGTRDDGIYTLDPEGNVQWRFLHGYGERSISDNFVRTIAEDENGIIWTGTSMGLDSYDKESGEWTNYKPDETEPGSLSDLSVFAIYRDMQNTMWVGTYYGGVNYFNPRRDIFRYYRASQTNPDRLSYPFVGSMIQDAGGNMWICTDGGGLNCFDPDTRKFTRYFYEEYNPDNMPRYHIKSIGYDRATGKLYMGVWGIGLWVFDTETRKGILHERRDWTVMNMQHYRGEIVANTGWEILKVDTGTDTLVPFSNDDELNRLMGGEYVYQFFIDGSGRIWLSSHSGLRRIDLATKQTREYRHDSADHRSFGTSTVMSFIETSEGGLFFGTLGSGLFRYNPSTDDFDNYNITNGAQVSDFSYHISEIDGGNLLILHNDSFSIFDPHLGSTVYHSTGNFPLSGFFEGNSSYITSEGEIFIGGVNGLASVYQADLADSSPIDYNLYFDRLAIDGKNVRPKDPTVVDEKNFVPLGTRRIRSMVIRFPESEIVPDAENVEVFPPDAVEIGE